MTQFKTGDVLSSEDGVLIHSNCANPPKFTMFFNGMTLKLTSSAFNDAGAIPARYTCEGDDVSPPLGWSGVPAGTRSFALIVDDPDAPNPDAPKMTYVHWVVYNIPPTKSALPEAVRRPELPAGAREGRTDSGKVGYGGPCPPIGRHRYYHKLYALDAMLPDLGSPTKAELESAIEGHVLEMTELIGTYRKEQQVV